MNLKRNDALFLLAAFVLILASPVGAVCPPTMPDSSCPAPPPAFTINQPPALTLPGFPPGPVPSCGGCPPPSGRCPVDGPCCEGTAYVDIRCFSRSAFDPDDTCRLKRAMRAARGKVLWIPEGLTLEVSSLGEDRCRENDGKPGVPIYSNTVVAGGGAGGTRGRIKLRVSSGEVNQDGYLLKISPNQIDPIVHHVWLTNLILDFNNGELHCTAYPGKCEHRHAVGIWDSNDVSITNCAFENLVGDGIYVNGTSGVGEDRRATSVPTRILVESNTFTNPNPDHQNRNGVSVVRGEHITIQANNFSGMGRTPMPGAIDLEANCPSDRIENVKIASNTITSPSPCSNRVGIGISNHAGAFYEDILVTGNTILGCAQVGIGVGGAGSKLDLSPDLSTYEAPLAGPIVVTNNTIDITGPTDASGQDRTQWGITVEGNVVSSNEACVAPALGRRVPSNAHVEGNTFVGNAPGGKSYGIFVSSSKAIVERNRIQNARLWGLWTDWRYSDGAAAAGLERNFCGNLACNSGTYTPPTINYGTGGIYTYGNDAIFSENQVHGAATGIWVGATGQGNTFIGNVFREVESCNTGSGCLTCHVDAGCQYLQYNDGGPNPTSCRECVCSTITLSAGRCAICEATDEMFCGPGQFTCCP